MESTKGDNMYNEETKRRYIEYKEASTIMCDNYLYRVFEAVSSSEIKAGKDIADFTSNEIIDYYKLVNKASVDSLVTLNNTLSLYTQWYINELLSIDHQNHFSELTRECLSRCVNKCRVEYSIIQRNELLESIKDLPNPSDSFIILALFEGINGNNYKELLKLHLSDFRDDTVTLYDGRKINVSPELTKWASLSAEEKYYYRLIREKEQSIKFLESDDTIIKSYPNTKSWVSERQQGKRIYYKIKKALDYMGLPWVSGNNLILSGKIHFINTRCAELGISGHDYIYSDRLMELNHQYGCNIVRSNFYNDYKDYLI